MDRRIKKISGIVLAGLVGARAAEANSGLMATAADWARQLWPAAEPQRVDVVPAPWRKGEAFPQDERPVRELHIQGPRPEPPSPIQPAQTPFPYRFRDAGDLRRFQGSLKPMPVNDFERITRWYRRMNLYAHWDFHRKARIARMIGDAAMEGVWFRGKRASFRLNTLGQRPVLRSKRHPLKTLRPVGGMVRFEHPYYAGYSLAVEAQVTNTTDKPLTDVQVWAFKKGAEQVQQHMIGRLEPGQTVSVRFSFFFKDRWVLGAEAEPIDLALAGAPEGGELEDLGHTL